MKTRLSVILVLLLLFLNVYISSIRTRAETDTQTDATKLKDYLKATYSKLQVAESKGANVTLAAQKLDEALQLIDQVKGDQNGSDSVLMSQATSIIDDVDSSIPSLTKDGESRILWTDVSLVSTIIFVAIVCLFVYLYLPRIMWKTWGKYRASWRVRPS